MASQIFISYRRDGGDVTAKLICETLKNRGYTVFYDYDALKGGVFDTRILDAIDGCADMVLVLPPRALDRCENEDDWVRQEIKRALSFTPPKNIIPVMLNGFEFPKNLPSDICGVTRYNGVRFHMDYFEAVIDKIVEKLSPETKPHKGTPVQSLEPTSKPDGNDDQMKQLLSLASTPEGRELLNSLLQKQNASVEAVSEPTQSESAHELKSKVLPAETSEGLEFTLNDDGEGYTVTNIADCVDMDVVVPGTYNGKPVTSIGESAFSDVKFIKSVTLSEGIKTIEERAFFKCSNLADVVFPESLVEIRAKAFWGCDSLRIINLSSGLRSIDDHAFEKCRSIEAFNVDPRNDAYCTVGPHLYTKDMERLVRYATACKDSSFTVPEGVTRICGFAFDGCSYLESVTVSEGVDWISAWSFQDCKELTSAVLPNTLTFVGEGIFYGCKKLKTVRIPSRLTSVSWGMFMGCSSLSDISIPPRISRIAQKAFAYCESLKTLKYKGTVEMWETVKLADGWTDKDSVKTIRCIDGDIDL